MKILLASHGNLAAGMLSSLELILGKQENVEVLCAYTDGEDNVAPRVKSFIESMEEEWIVFTDLFGGSINNEFMKYIHKSEMHLVCGMSLPLVMTAVLGMNASQTVDETMADIKDSVLDVVHFCSEDMITDAEEDEEF